MHHRKLLRILYSFKLFIKRRFEHCLVMCTTCSSKYFIYINDLLSITLPKAISNTEESLQYCERFLYISFGVYINNSLPSQYNVLHTPPRLTLSTQAMTVQCFNLK